VTFKDTWLPTDLRAGHATAHNQLADTLSGVFSVKAYGAKGDAATDDVTAIQAAITACGNNRIGGLTYGGIVYFPPGLYYISVPLIVNQPMVTLMGAGSNASQILAGTWSGNAMIAASATRCAIRDLQINGNTFQWACQPPSS
jgi:Pectate lyase superfamily protein